MYLSKLVGLKILMQMITKVLSTKGIVATLLFFGGNYVIKRAKKYFKVTQYVDRGIIYTCDQLFELDHIISTFSSQYSSRAEHILKELVSIPGKYDQNDIFRCAFDTITNALISENAVFGRSNIFVDNGNLISILMDPHDNSPFEKRKVVLITHDLSSLGFECDWGSGFGFDPYNGEIDFESLDTEKIRLINPRIPSSNLWDNLIIGNGTCGGLQGIASTIISQKILVETSGLGSLKGCIVISSFSFEKHHPYISVYGNQIYPDVIICAEATGTPEIGPCNIALGQLGKSIIRVEIGDNDLSLFSQISENYKWMCGSNPSGHSFLGKSSYECTLDAENSTIHFCRTLVPGDPPGKARTEIDDLPTMIYLKSAKKSHAIVEVEHIPPFITPIDERSVLAATDSYRRTVSPWIDNDCDPEIPKQHINFIKRYKSECVAGYPAKMPVPSNKKWMKTGKFVSPPILCIGAGFPELSGKPGEFVFFDHLQQPIALVARFPSLFIKEFK